MPRLESYFVRPIRLGSLPRIKLEFIGELVDAIASTRSNLNGPRPQREARYNKLCLLYRLHFCIHNVGDFQMGLSSSAWPSVRLHTD